LTQRTQKEGQRRVFYDFTCSAPKSVSVLAVTLDDQRLIAAHEAAATHQPPRWTKASLI
jgi:conjugative relaxase-like TrwC/TraI family protein